MRWVDGLPCDIGASDAMDSARLAGIMVLFDHPQAPNLGAYIVNDHLGVRHPVEFPANNPNNFSRDQEVCLIAGLNKQNHISICEKLYVAAKERRNFAQNIEDDKPGTLKKFPNGPDWLSPSVMNHLRMCANKGSSIFGKAWLVLDVIYNAIFTPTRESNQLLAQLMIAGPKWIKFYKKITPKWRQAITDYWSGWRGEPELAQLMILKLEAI